MLRYTSTAIALKLFSVPPLDSLYRWAGNTLGAKERMKKAPQYYYDRIHALSHLNDKYGLIKGGDRVLELGTGWMHWDALAAKMMCDVSATLYDVWDCRQFTAIKKQAEYTREILHELPLPKHRATQVLNAITNSQNLDEMYDRLAFKYVCSDRLPTDKNHDFVVSGGVFEHVSDVPQLVSDMVAAIKPGAYTLNVINIADHLTYYGSKCHQKKYLEIPKWAWSLLYNNKIQHQNRWQKSQYYKCFSDHGLKLIEDNCTNIDDDISSDLDPDDAQCVWVRCLHKMG